MGVGSGVGAGSGVGVGVSVRAAGAADLALRNAGPFIEFRQAEASAVKVPYLLLAATLFVLGGIFAALKLPSVDSSPDCESRADLQLNLIQTIRSHRHLA